VYRSFLSWRYLFARPSNLIGMLGIFLAVGALIMILSIMTGFLEEARRSVRGSLSDMIIEPDPADQHSAGPGPILAAVRSDPRVRGASVQLNWGGIITQRGRPYERVLADPLNSQLLAIQLVGVDIATPLRFAWPVLRLASAAQGGLTLPSPIQDEFDATHFWTSLNEDPEDPMGNVGWPVENPLLPFLPPRRYKPEGRPLAAVVIGQQLANNLFLRPGDQIEIQTVVHDPDTGEWHPNNRSFVVAGTFRSKDNEADSSRICLARSELEDFLGESMSFSQVLVRLRDYDRDALAVRDDLRESLSAAGLISSGMNAHREVRTWEGFRGNLLGAIRNERFLMGLMLGLVLLVSGFLIFAIVSMMVMAKRRDIGVLSALGATPRGIMQTFLMIAFWETLVGALLGAAGGTLAAIKIDTIERWLSTTLGIQIFDRKVYLFDHIPSVVDPLWVATIVAGAFAVALLFAAYPARRAARLDPLEALRYE